MTQGKILLLRTLKKTTEDSKEDPITKDPKENSINEKPKGDPIAVKPKDNSINEDPLELQDPQ